MYMAIFAKKSHQPSPGRPPPPGVALHNGRTTAQNTKPNQTKKNVAPLSRAACGQELPTRKARANMMVIRLW